LANGITLFSSLANIVSGLARKTNTLANARLHISAHYDISNSMFAAFLSPDMTYSCPIWKLKSSAEHEEESLEAAQYTKLNYFISQAHIQPTDHVLEIGSGWGSFAIAAVKATGCRVTTLTLSTEQKVLAEERIAAAGLSDRIEVLLCDYRALPPPPEGYFDKVVSIEMLEAVGAEFLMTYFGCIDKLLKPEGGIAVFQCITIPETRYEAYAKGNDFIREYIFPGGHLPAVSQLVANIHAGSQGKLIVDDIKNIGGHYAKTLRQWGEKFEENFDRDIKPALLLEHKDMCDKDVEVFRRKWKVSFYQLRDPDDGGKLTPF
jgi:cyclopropane-fatty-acyl-phospholipid synthase